MANNCCWEMKIVGDKFYDFAERLETFGRVYEVEHMEDEPNEYMVLAGDCAWSINTAMIDYGLADLTKEYGVSLEVYSQEPGFGFEEHYLISNGEIVINQCVDYHESFIDELDDIEEEAKFHDMTRDEFMSHVEDGIFRYGGFEFWDFSNLDRYRTMYIDKSGLDELLGGI